MKKIDTRKINILLVLLIVFITNLNIVSKAEVVKPTYADWLREFHGYDESVTDKEILDEKLKEDEAGRVLYKDPAGLKYDPYKGVPGTPVETLPGFTVGGLDTSSSKVNYKKANGNFTYFNQGDPQWKSHRINSTTIGRGGCGPTTLAMIVNTLKDPTMNPIKMGDWACQNGYFASTAAYHSLFYEGAMKLGLKVNKINQFDKQGIADALGRGNAVVMLAGPGRFTSSGHFILLTGIDEKGMVSMNNSASKADLNRKYSVDTLVKEAKSNFWEIY